MRHPKQKTKVLDGVHGRVTKRFTSLGDRAMVQVDLSEAGDKSVLVTRHIHRVDGRWLMCVGLTPTYRVLGEVKYAANP